MPRGRWAALLLAQLCFVSHGGTSASASSASNGAFPADSAHGTDFASFYAAFQRRRERESAQAPRSSIGHDSLSAKAGAHGDAATAPVQATSSRIPAPANDFTFAGTNNYENARQHYTQHVSISAGTAAGAGPTSAHATSSRREAEAQPSLYEHAARHATAQDGNSNESLQELMQEIVEEANEHTPTPSPGPAPAPQPPAPAPPPDAVAGGWSDFNNGECVGTCDDGMDGPDGTMSRSRTCTNPAPAHGGANCSGASADSVPCAPAVRCPTAMVPMSVSLSCDDFNTAARAAFVTGIAAAIGVVADHVFLDEVSCDQSRGQGGAGRVRRRRLISTSYGVNRSAQGAAATAAAVARMVQLHRRQLQENSSSAEAPPRTSMIARVTLSADEAQQHGGASESIIELQDEFESDDFSNAMQAAGGDVSGADLSAAFASTAVDVDSIYDQNHIVNEGGDTAFKGVIFLTFVICLTFFVAIVLSVVVWLEWKKCQSRDQYNQF